MNWASVAWALAMVVVALVLRPVVVEYGRAKGKNLADKEDVAKITRLVEDVKHENAMLLESMKNRQQLRVAAVEKRLEAHQEGFTLWRKLLVDRNDRQRVGEVVLECQTWWEHNCLYLSPEAREAFNAAYFAAGIHPTLLESGERGPDSLRDLKANWALVLAAGDALLRGAELPTLGEVEFKNVKSLNEQERPG